MKINLKLYYYVLSSVLIILCGASTKYNGFEASLGTWVILVL